MTQPISLPGNRTAGGQAGKSLPSSHNSGMALGSWKTTLVGSKNALESKNKSQHDIALVRLLL